MLVAKQLTVAIDFPSMEKSNVEFNVYQKLSTKQRGE